MQNRRHFLTTGFSLAAAGLAGAAALTRARESLAEEASPETATVRLPKIPGYTCVAPPWTSSTIFCARRGSSTSATSS